MKTLSSILIGLLIVVMILFLTGFLEVVSYQTTIAKGTGQDYEQAMEEYRKQYEALGVINGVYTPQAVDNLRRPMPVEVERYFIQFTMPYWLR
jgi:hypothetical protein